MNRQQKIQHLENEGYKVSTLMNGDGIILKKGMQNQKYSSVSAAHKAVFGY